MGDAGEGCIERERERERMREVELRLRFSGRDGRWFSTVSCFGSCCTDRVRVHGLHGVEMEFALAGLLGFWTVWYDVVAA